MLETVKKQSDHPVHFEGPSELSKIHKKKKKKLKSPETWMVKIHNFDPIIASNETKCSEMETSVSARHTKSAYGTNILHSPRKKFAVVHSNSDEREDHYVASDENNSSSVENLKKKKNSTKLKSKKKKKNSTKLKSKKKKNSTKLKSKKKKKKKVFVTSDLDSSNVLRETGSSDAETNAVADNSESLDKSNIQKSSKRKRVSNDSNSVERDSHCVISDVTNMSSENKRKKKKLKSQKNKVSDEHGFDSLNVLREARSSNMETNTVSNDTESFEKDDVQNSPESNGSLLNSDLTVVFESDICRTIKDEGDESMGGMDESDSSDFHLVFTDSEDERSKDPVCDTPSAPPIGSDSFLANKSCISIGDVSFKSNEEFEKFVNEISSRSTYSLVPLTEKVSNILILVKHPHPLHCSDISISRLPPKEFRNDILKDFTVREGSFTKQEDDVLMKNWKQLCKKCDLESPEPFLYPRQYKMNSLFVKSFVQFLGQGLPNRLLFHIYSRFKYLTEHKNKGLFSKEEDELILRVMRMPLKAPYNTLSKILKRNRQSVYKRHKMLLESKKDEQSNTKEKRIVWTIEIATSVVKSLRKIYKLTDIEELRDRRIPSKIWKKVEKYTNLSYWKLRQFWCYQLHVQLFAHSPISENHILKKLVHWLQQTKPKSIKDVSWNNSIHLFPGSTDWFMWERFRRLRRRHHAENFSNLEGFLKFLKNEPSCIVLPKDRVTPRYRVKKDFTLAVIAERKVRE